MKPLSNNIPLDDRNDLAAPWVKARLAKLPKVVARLRAIRELIRRDYQHFNMADWITENEGCGTTCCIGGWYAFKHPKVKQARKNEGYSDGSGYTPDMLVYDLVNGLKYNHEGYRFNGNIRRLVCNFEWPEPFRTEFSTTTDKRLQARIAARRITHFIKTGE